MRKIAQERNCAFPSLEQALPRLAPRPLFMIHGGGDTYIKPEMAFTLYQKARDPKDLWIVENAKHNQAHQVARDDYQRRVLEFFDRHLGTPQPAPVEPPAPAPALVEAAPL